MSRGAARSRSAAGHASRPRRRAPGAASSGSSSAPAPASARPTRCWRPRAACARAASTSWSATSSRTGASRPSGCSKVWSNCRRCRCSYRGTCVASSTSTPGCKRRPAILIVDELAHSNLIEGDPPPRHAKRWQDIEELLEAGHQRLDDGERPAPRESQRPGRADHRRASARDDPGPHLRRSRRGRADRPAARRSARAPARPARSTCRSRSRPRSSVSSASRT